jgi:hypothetical protein
MDAWCDVTIDGQEFGRADRHKPIEVPAGKHAIVCSQGPGLGEWRGTVTLVAGQRKELTGSVLRPCTVVIDVARATIAGTSYRRGDQVTLRPGRYRVETGDAGTWVSVPRVTTCTLRDSPTLDCYP